MKLSSLLLVLVLCSGRVIVPSAEGIFAQGVSFAAETKKSEQNFEHYRKTIKDAFGIDIIEFKNRLPGGKADGKQLTKYDLTQLLMGIEVELEHTNDKMLALEITTDHLEEFSDYYTRLKKMEEEAERETTVAPQGKQASTIIVLQRKLC